MRADLIAGAQEPPDALCLGRPLFTGVAPHIEGHRSVKLDMRRWHGHPERGRAPWRIEQTEEERVSGRHLPRRRGPPEGVPELKHVEHIQGRMAVNSARRLGSAGYSGGKVIEDRHRARSKKRARGAVQSLSRRTRASYRLVFTAQRKPSGA